MNFLIFLPPNENTVEITQFILILSSLINFAMKNNWRVQEFLFYLN